MTPRSASYRKTFQANRFQAMIYPDDCGHLYLESDCPVCSQAYWDQTDIEAKLERRASKDAAGKP